MIIGWNCSITGLIGYLIDHFNATMLIKSHFTTFHNILLLNATIALIVYSNIASLINSTSASAIAIDRLQWSMLFICTNYCYAWLKLRFWSTADINIVKVKINIGLFVLDFLWVIFSMLLLIQLLIKYPWFWWLFLVS